MNPLTYPASRFKAECLRLLDEIAADGRSIVITKRGRPIARVEPFFAKQKGLRGSWKGVVRIKGDIVGFDLSQEWESNR